MAGLRNYVVVSRELRTRIIQQLFEGYSQAESHASLRRFIKSETTIRNYREEFLRYEEEMEAKQEERSLLPEQTPVMATAWLH